jgi:hypothetical protein
VCPQDEVPASEAYEHSELLMYKAQVLAEGGQQEAALALLDAEQVRGGAAALSTAQHGNITRSKERNGTEYWPVQRNRMRAMAAILAQQDHVAAVRCNVIG